MTGEEKKFFWEDKQINKVDIIMIFAAVWYIKIILDIQLHKNLNEG